MNNKIPKAITDWIKKTQDFFLQFKKEPFQLQDIYPLEHYAVEYNKTNINRVKGPYNTILLHHHLVGKIYAIIGSGIFKDKWIEIATTKSTIHGYFICDIAADIKIE